MPVAPVLAVGNDGRKHKGANRNSQNVYFNGRLYSRVKQADRVGPVKTYKHTCFYGFGDNIYERPFVVEAARQFDRVYIETHFPELYWDQPADKFLFVRPAGRPHLLLQNQNADAFNGYAKRAPVLTSLEDRHFDFRVHKNIEGLPRPDFYAKLVAGHFGGMRPQFKLPLRNDWVVNGYKFLEGLRLNKKVCIFRPPTIQKGWPCPERNPRPEYMQQIIDAISQDYFVIAVGNFAHDYEKPVAEFKGVDLDLTAGQLDIYTLVGAMQFADVCLSGPGHFTPVSLATDARCFVVYGGYEAPRVHIADWMNHDRHGYAAPTQENMESKTIDNLVERFKKWEARQCQTKQ